MQKNKYFYFIIASIALYFFSTISMEPPPPQAPITNNNIPIIPPPLFPPIPPSHNKPILGFEIKDLSQLAPIAISMYCYNELPRFTMVCLSLMLIYTLTTKELYKKNILRALKQYRKSCINFSLRFIYYFKNKVSFFMGKHYCSLPEHI